MARKLQGTKALLQEGRPMTGRVLIVTAPERRAAAFAAAHELIPDAVWAGNCHDAREALRRAPPSVVITDLTLPDGNWWTVYRALAEAGQCAECIVLAPRAGGNRSALFEAGAFAVLDPPWSSNELSRAVTAAKEAQRRYAMAGRV